uniref:Uncharacterized protein n=1 Tax=Avena sativa TaxID=4498 RepID=A0ACD5TL00_AVESA
MAGRLLLFVAAVALALLLVSPRPTMGYPWPVCDDNGVLADSEYKASISGLAATMPKNASTSPGLFATVQAGVAPEQVWALAFCRGDATASYCSSCIAQGFKDLAFCEYKEAIIFYDSCLLTYTNVHFRAADDVHYSSYYQIRNLLNATAEPARFQRVVAELMNATATSAAFNSSTRLYASGQADFDKELPEIYTWAQCTPDMSQDSCWACLARGMALLPTYFTDGIGGRVLGIRCIIRYETQPFFNGSVTVRLSSATSAPGPAPNVVPNNNGTSLPAVEGGKMYSVPIIVPTIVLPIVAVICLLVCFFLWRRPGPVTEEKQPYPKYSAETQDMESIDSMMIDISTLRAATGDFAESNIIGEGGFGAVYKGTLPDGEEIAVKRMSNSSIQGVEELKNELALVAKLSHKNLVRLIGVCLEQQERLLVYEFVPNRSLDLILFARDSAKQLDWVMRYKIIEGIARGLQYLHEDSQLKVVHRDLKANNILLDMKFSPKISDFGLAKIFGREQTQAITSRVVGTHGYMAPEYMMRGNYSAKSDAFSFGVMVLEIVTGRRNTDDDSSQQSEDLLSKVWEHWTTGTVLEIVDPCMNGGFLEKEVLKCVHIGLLCVQGNPGERPAMSTVVTMLGSETFTLHALSKPRMNGVGADYAGNMP